MLFVRARGRGRGQSIERSCRVPAQVMTKMRKDRDGNLVPLGSQARPPRLHRTSNIRDV
jgi:hypothetical protein